MRALGGSDAVRRRNLAGLLGHVHCYGATSRADLTRRLRVNRSTVASLAEALVARGLVEECDEPTRTARGRPSKVVMVRAERVVALAVEVRVDGLCLGTVGLGGTILDRRGLPHRSGEREPAQVVDTIADLARPLLEGLSRASVLAGVGVSVPSPVRNPGGVVDFAPNLGWQDVPLAAQLRDRLGVDVPVRLGNDADLGALAEHTRGAAIGVANVLYLTAEVGVGAGVIVDGAVLRGASGVTGEVGHLRVNPRGRACHCGGRGCWETEVGERALLERAGRDPDAGLSAVTEVLAAAAAGDRVARRSVRATVDWLVPGLVGLLNVFNPDLVVLGGMFAGLFALESRRLEQGVREGVMTPAHGVARIVTARLGDDAVLLGAAELALQSALADPASVPYEDHPGHAGVGSL